MANAPTYILYHGKATGKDKQGKKIWTRIGAVWPNKSGKGFNLTWEYLPLARYCYAGYSSGTRCTSCSCLSYGSITVTPSPRGRYSHVRLKPLPLLLGQTAPMRVQIFLPCLSLPVALPW